MAEVVATMVVGPLLSIVKDKASSYILDKYKVMEGMEEQHRVLKRKLPAILDVIDDAEQVASNRAGVKAWLDEVKRVAYEANEIFDEFKYEALRREAKKNGHYSNLRFDAVKLFPTHNRFVFRDKMGKKLCRVVQDIQVLVAEMNAFGFKYQQQAPASKQWRQTDHVIFDPKEIISRSRSQDTKNIVEMLLGQASNENLMVLPIVGVGGLGKTTLAQLIYNEPEVQKHFELLIWVCVSDSFDVNSLANSIVEAATSNKSAAEEGSKKSPLDKLQEGLSGRRYLLVLDDVWNRDSDKWEKLKERLTHGAKGSVVLTTTRDKGVAKVMGTVKAYDLAALDNAFIKEIIETRAFSLQEEEERPAELVIDEVVKRCRGSPLAATALGSVLRTKTSEEEWKAIARISNICTEESGILPILKLSYNDLSSQMKQCFSFCAVFPKDYEIDVDKLIQLWIAHGFIQEQKEVSPETIGKRIFNELASRSFFVDVKQVRVSFNERRKGNTYSKHTCQIHDLMHDVALSTMEKECALALEKPIQTEWLPDTARHLFLSCEEPGTILNASLVERPLAVQTLLCDRDMKDPLRHLSKYSSLKALHIWLWSRSSFPFKSKHLHHLRYLDLSRSDIKEIPEDISILYNLQTLNVSGCGNLHRLPRQMKYMTALRHLYTHGCRKIRGMPSDLQKLMSLQTLTCFVAGPTGSEYSGVGELQKLNLGGQLELCQLENVTVEDAISANLGNKRELQELTLKWSVGSREGDDARVLKGLKPHDGLQAVSIESYGGTTFPTWIAMLQNMVEIHICNCKKLRWLFGCDTFSTFPNLKTFTLKGLECLEGLWEITNEEQGEEVLFPRLEKLSIVGCTKLTVLPGNEKITTLSGGKEKNCPKLTIIAESPNLSVLYLEGSEEEMFLWVARHMTSLTNLTLKSREDMESSFTASDHGLVQVVDTMEKWNHKDFPLADMRLIGLKSGVTELCACFVQLQDLVIVDCAALVHWPEKEFQSLVSLRRLCIGHCKQLVGCAEAPAAEPSTASEPSSQLLPRLESLYIPDCESMVEVFKLPPSLRTIRIDGCSKLNSIFSRSLQQGESAPSILQGSPVQSEVSSSSAVTRAEHSLFPYLEDIYIIGCDSLTGVLDLPPSLKKILVSGCDELRSVESHSGEFPLLEDFRIVRCKTLSSLPDGPQAYPSLRDLRILGCPGIKRLPTCLQQRLRSVGYTRLDSRYQEPSLLKPKTWRNIIR